jgi:hypothetical protein
MTASFSSFYPFSFWDPEVPSLPFAQQLTSAFFIDQIKNQLGIFFFFFFFFFVAVPLPTALNRRRLRCLELTEGTAEEKIHSHMTVGHV